jgi:hypothetical protein
MMGDEDTGPAAKFGVGLEIRWMDGRADGSSVFCHCGAPFWLSMGGVHGVEWGRCT